MIKENIKNNTLELSLKKYPPGNSHFELSKNKAYRLKKKVWRIH